MIVRHNLSALHSLRKLTENNNKTSKSIEKLSSGLRINRAGDDSAGLAISEKMRGQIRGLQQAQINAQDGVSLVQTAEGGLNETHAILQRMRELVVQAANDTNTSEDRMDIQKEIDQLKEGVNNIANFTEFNTINLLNRNGGSNSSGEVSVIDGSETQLTLTTDYDTQPSWVGDKISFTRGSDIYLMNADGTNQSLLVSGATQSAISSDGTKIAYVRSDGNLYVSNIDGSGQVQLTNSGDVNSDQTFGSRLSWHPNGNEILFKSTSGIEKVSLSSVRSTVIASSDSGSPSITPDGNKLVFQKSDGIYTSNIDGTGETRIFIGSGSGSLQPVFSPDGTKIAFTSMSTDTMDQEIFIMNIDGTNVTDITGSMSSANSHSHNIFPIWSSDGSSIAFHSDNVADPSTSGDIWMVQVSGTSSVGGNGTGEFLKLQIGANTNQTLTIFLTDARTTALGIDNISVLNHGNTTNALTKIDKAIQNVSSERSKYGAYQNRLEHTMNNLSTTGENLTASESRIRDVDMAKEMMYQTKQSILSQAAQAMLAQANQQTQGVLQLLR